MLSLPFPLPVICHRHFGTNLPYSHQWLTLELPACCCVSFILWFELNCFWREVLKHLFSIFDGLFLLQFLAPVAQEDPFFLNFCYPWPVPLLHAEKRPVTGYSDSSTVLTLWCCSLSLSWYTCTIRCPTRNPGIHEGCHYLTEECFGCSCTQNDEATHHWWRLHQEYPQRSLSKLQKKKTSAYTAGQEAEWCADVSSRPWRHFQHSLLEKLQCHT